MFVLYALFQPAFQHTGCSFGNTDTPVILVLRRLLLRDAKELIRDVDPVGARSFDLDWSESCIERDRNQGGELPPVRSLPVLWGDLRFRLLEPLGEMCLPPVAFGGGERRVVGN